MGEGAGREKKPNLFGLFHSGQSVVLVYFAKLETVFVSGFLSHSSSRRLRLLSDQFLFGMNSFRRVLIRIARKREIGRSRYLRSPWKRGYWFRQYPLFSQKTKYRH